MIREVCFPENLWEAQLFPGICASFEGIGLAVDAPESSYVFVEAPGVSGVEDSDPFRFFDLAICTWAVVVEIFKYAELRSDNTVVGFVEVFGHDGSFVLTSTFDVSLPGMVHFQSRGLI